MFKRTNRGKSVKINRPLIFLFLVLCVCLLLYFLVDSLSANDNASDIESSDNNASNYSNADISESEIVSEENDADLYVPPTYEVSENRTTYQDGFYYEPVSDNQELMNRICNLSYNESINTQVTFDELSYIRVKYINFDNKEAEGEIISNTAIAQDLVEIFYDLYIAEYQIESIRLVDDFNADDDASMAANNTSCFNFRTISGTSSLSNHSYGLAIDINPLYNPYIYTSNGETVVDPANGTAYADRSLDFEHKIDENDLCYRLFTKHGFEWGGSWDTVKDYQHFEKIIG